MINTLRNLFASNRFEQCIGAGNDLIVETIKPLQFLVIYL